MVLYNFKTIQVVPTGKDFIDIVLSKTQRQTPTVVHNGWAITRIRQFYMRKVQHLLASLFAAGVCCEVSKEHEKPKLLCVTLYLQVKFTSSNWHDKLTRILEDFPKMDDMHPFFADLLNVLYDRDHYKLALGQLHTARSLIDKVSQGASQRSRRTGACPCCCEAAQLCSWECRQAV